MSLIISQSEPDIQPHISLETDPARLQALMRDERARGRRVQYHQTMLARSLADQRTRAEMYADIEWERQELARDLARLPMMRDRLWWHRRWSLQASLPPEERERSRVLAIGVARWIEDVERREVERRGRRERQRQSSLEWEELGRQARAREIDHRRPKSWIWLPDALRGAEQPQAVRDQITRATDVRGRVERMSRRLMRISEVQGERMMGCGRQIAVDRCECGEARRVVALSNCHVRVCPACAQRRTRRAQARLFRMLHHLEQQHPTHGYVLLTLTAPTVADGSLSEAIQHRLDSWRRLQNRRPFKKAMRGGGAFRALEITRSKGRWHPHMHVLLHVSSSYWTRWYMKHDDWRDLWTSAARSDERLVVDVRGVRHRGRTDRRDRLKGAAVEVAKYVTKSDDLERMDDRQLIEFMDATHRRRFHAWTGTMADAKRHVEAEYRAQVEKERLTQCADPACSICGSAWLRDVLRWTSTGYAAATPKTAP